MKAPHRFTWRGFLLRGIQAISVFLVRINAVIKRSAYRTVARTPRPAEKHANQPQVGRTANACPWGTPHNPDTSKAAWLQKRRVIQVLNSV